MCLLPLVQKARHSCAHGATEQRPIQCSSYLFVLVLFLPIGMVHFHFLVESQIFQICIKKAKILMLIMVIILFMLIRGIN